jgi:Mlc titration factor MtfA (ptsG expression regulator)
LAACGARVAADPRDGRDVVFHQFAHDLAELFAVATEALFERPRELP